MAKKADCRDCLDLAGEIARSVESYGSDDLVGHLANLLRPTVGRIQELEAANAVLFAACQSVVSQDKFQSGVVPWNLLANAREAILANEATLEKGAGN